MLSKHNTIVKETATHITVRYVYDDGVEVDGRQQKLLCIGGPFNGQTKAAFQIGDRYCQYNRGEYRRKGTPHKAVYIHESGLQ
jgi:hypothetical protein